MNLKRNLLVIALLFSSFMIWRSWEKDKIPHVQQQNIQTTITESKGDIQNKAVITQEKRITVKTDVLKLTINTHGGDIEQALLLAYPKGTKSNEPFPLLTTTPEFIYQARSGLVGRDGLDNLEKNLRPIFNVKKDNFVLEDDQNEITIPMIYTDAVGNTFTKTFILKGGEYVVKVNYTIQNVGKKPLEFSILGQLKQSVYLPSYQDTKSSNFVLHTFRGAAYSTEDYKYRKYKFDTIANNKNLNITSKGGWVAMLQQYFVIAWIPNNDEINNFYTTNLGNDTVAISYQSASALVEPNQATTLSSTLWIGPEIQDKMATIAPYLDLTVDYGWLWFISQPLFKLLKFIHSFLGNWGFSIIVITFIVRVIMYPLTKAQYTSMAKLRMLQPKIQEIRRRLSNDKQRQSNEIITLYKKEKVNPLGGCFPLLIQMPIFLALYYMLIGSVELRCAPFAFWIHDLSAQDPYYILPILMGITMFFIQKMSPNSVSDPTQKKIMTMMPIIFTVCFLWFPSGLVLYYIISNLVTIIQQWLIYRGLEKCGLHSPEKSSDLFK